ncbi:MAG TPA: hypothetical protein VIR15_01295, partial [Intrasporangium sp.]|uniref:hypothetical protein n=1 Tax=Intrasporangium sp. TaxID=1925024 RepID=UPI002F93E214
MPKESLGRQVRTQLVEVPLVSGLTQRPRQLLDPIGDCDDLLGRQMQGQNPHPILGQLGGQPSARRRLLPSGLRHGRIVQRLQYPGQPLP